MPILRHEINSYKLILPVFETINRSKSEMTRQKMSEKTRYLEFMLSKLKKECFNLCTKYPRIGKKTDNKYEKPLAIHKIYFPPIYRVNH